MDLLIQANELSARDSQTLETVGVTLESEQDELKTITCSRCRAVVVADSSFCSMCGGRLKAEKAEKKVDRKTNSGSGQRKSKKSEGRKSGAKVNVVEDFEGSDAVKMPHETQLLALLSAPLLSKEQEEWTRDSLRRTNQLEMDNAMLLESSSLSMLQEKEWNHRMRASLSAASTALCLSFAEESKITLPAIKGARRSQGNPLQQPSAKRQKRRRADPRPVLIDNYLDEVGSIQSHFDSFVSRTYEYQGIRSIVREKLVPLEKRPFNELELKRGIDGEFSDTIRPLSKLVNNRSNNNSSSIGGSTLLGRGYNLEEDSSIALEASESVTESAAAAPSDENVNEEEEEPEQENLNEGIDFEPQSIHDGSAFLWGPLFDSTADFTAQGSLETVRQREDERRQYSLRGDYEVSAEDPVFRKETEAEKREEGSESRDIFFWGDLMNDNKPAHESEPMLADGETAAHFDEEYLVSRLLRWNQGYVDSVTPPDTESDTESEDEPIDLTVNDPDTLTARYEQLQSEVNAQTSEQMQLQKDLPRVTWDDLRVVEDLEDRHAADREEYAGKDEAMVMALKNEVIAINEARDEVFLSRQSKMERFERQMRRDIRHAKRKLRKFERQRWKDIMKASTQLYIDSVLHSGVTGGDPSLLAALPEPVPHEAIFELFDEHDLLEESSQAQKSGPISEAAAAAAGENNNGGGSFSGSFSSVETSGFNSTSALSRQGTAASLLSVGDANKNTVEPEELVSKQFMRLADKLTHSNDESLLIKIENTRKHNRNAEERFDMVKVHVEDPVALKLIQSERELMEMQRRVDMLNVEKLIDSDRLVDHPEKLDELGLKDLADELAREIKKQTADQLELTSKPHNLTDDEAYIYGIESNMLKIRTMTENLDYQQTIMNMQIAMNNNIRERDIHELTRKVGAIRAENVLKLEGFTKMVEEREKRQAEEKRQREEQEYLRSAEVNLAKKAERKRNRKHRKKQQQQAGGGGGDGGDANSESRPGTAATDGSAAFDSALTSPRLNSEGLPTSRSEYDSEEEEEEGGERKANDYDGAGGGEPREIQAEVKPSIFLDETTDMQRVEQLEADQVMRRTEAEDADVEGIRQMQLALNQFEHSRESIGIERSHVGEYFDVGQREAPLSEMDILRKRLEQKNQRELSTELSSLDLIQAPDLIEMMDAQIVAIKKSVETLDTDVINFTFNQFNQLQAHRDQAEQHKVQIREVEEGRLDSLPLDEMGAGTTEEVDEEAAAALASSLVPLSMIREVAELIKREMAQLCQRKEAEESDTQSMASLQEGLRADNQARMDLERARQAVLSDLDQGYLPPEGEEQRVLTPPPAVRKVLTVEELQELLGEEDRRVMSEQEVEDRQRQVEVSELKLSEADKAIQEIETSHADHRRERARGDTEFLFLQQGDILKAREESEAVEKTRRIEAVELEQALVIGNPSAFAGQSNAELASLHIARDSAKLELLEKTLVFKRTIEEARDDVTMAENLNSQLEGQQTRETLGQLRQQQLDLVEKDVEEENSMIAEKIEAQAKMKKKNRMKEAILYNSTLVDQAAVADNNLEYVLGTDVKNLVVADELSLEMKVEHAEIIQRSQEELADQHRMDQLLGDFNKMQVHFDEQAYQRQIQVEQLYEEAGILMLGEEPEEEVVEATDNTTEVVQEEEKVKPYISRRRQRREEALRNRVIPDKITVEVKTAAAPVVEARERLLVVSEAELQRYRNRRMNQMSVVNNLMAIKRLYSDSYSRLQRAVEDMQIDFKVNPKTDLTTTTKTLVALTRNKLMSCYDTLEDATKVNALVNAEYQMFQEALNLKRTQATLDLAEAMAAIGQLEQSYREKYAAAAREFKAAADANEFSFVSATGKHITSSKQMDAIKLEAEQALAKQGAVIKTMQAKEAQLVLNIK